MAKTPVKEIRLFDGDRFSQHNAFRAPGAPSVEELRAKPQKVNYLAKLYSKMRNGIVPVDASNIAQLKGLDFVFLCLDKGAIKKLIVQAIEAYGVPFIDVGMGVLLGEGKFSGIARVTTSTPQMREQVWKGRISFFDGDDAANEYSTNIQIAELNALNVALAVIRWKKLFGFYRDSSKEHYCGYSIASNEIVNEEEG